MIRCSPAAPSLPDPPISSGHRATDDTEHPSISVAMELGGEDNGCVLVWLFPGSGVGCVGVCPPISMRECPLWLLDIQTTPDASPRPEEPPRRGLRPALLQPALPRYLTPKPDCRLPRAWTT